MKRHGLVGVYMVKTEFRTWYVVLKEEENSFKAELINVTPEFKRSGVTSASVFEFSGNFQSGMDAARYIVEQHEKDLPTIPNSVRTIYCFGGPKGSQE